MHQFDPKLSLKDNHQMGDDVEFAAWELAGHDHREEFRDSGKFPQRSAWLRTERMRLLREALANGALVAIGMAGNDTNFDLIQIPENLFLSGDLNFDGNSSSISAMGREFVNIQICRAQILNPTTKELPKTVGRPNHLSIIQETWEFLNSELHDFVNLGKSLQNSQIQEMAAKLFPGQFPGNHRIGESTIRRHRRERPDLFN